LGVVEESSCITAKRAKSAKRRRRGGEEEGWGRGKHEREGAPSPQNQYNYYAINFWRFAEARATAKREKYSMEKWLIILRKTKPQMNADERRFIARAYIAFFRLFISVVPCKKQVASPQSAQSPQRGGGAAYDHVINFYKQHAINFPALRGGRSNRKKVTNIPRNNVQSF
jgi:hypothetical protein